MTENIVSPSTALNTYEYFWTVLPFIVTCKIPVFRNEEEYCGECATELWLMAASG
jgi:hypothetical protein